MKNVALAWLILALTLAFALGPYFVEPFMGYTADVLPKPQPNPAIQPAGYAFAIWGLIYGWLIVSAVYGVYKQSETNEWRAARIAIAPSLFIGIFWTWIANNSAIWGTLTIWIMLGFAIIAAMRAPWSVKWWQKAPYALYAGWLSAASFVSLGVTLAGFGILFEEPTWALIGIMVATVLAITVQFRLGGMPTYGLAVVWALVGIVVGNTDNIYSITITTAIAAALITAVTFISWRRA